MFYQLVFIHNAWLHMTPNKVHGNFQQKTSDKNLRTNETRGFN